MTLVERFIDFTDWPTSRKTALAGAIAVPGLLFILVAVLFLQPAAVNVMMLVHLFLFGVVITLKGLHKPMPAYEVQT
jgi:hypothetical protein